MKIITIANTKEKWAVKISTKIYSFDSEEIHTFFIDMLDFSEETLIYIQNLDNYFMDILRIVNFAGLTDCTASGKKKPRPGEYNYLVSDDGKCFSIVINNMKTFVNIRNFEMLIPIKKASDLWDTYLVDDWQGDAVQKTAIAMYRAVVEISQLLQSTEIPLTISSLSLKEWQNTYSKYDRNVFFKNADLEKVHGVTLEEYIRPAYHGGWCCLNYEKPHIITKADHINGVTLDVNSLYPFVMSECSLPYGKPYTWTGEIPDAVQKMADTGHAYYYIRLKAHIDLKPGHLPCVQIGDNILYRDWIETTEIYTNAKLSKPTFTLTMTDYELLKEHYYIKDMEVLDGVYFKATTGLYKSFINRFYSMKQHAKTPGQRKVAKMIQNSLSGNMAKRRHRKNMIIDPTKTGAAAFSDMIESDVKGVNYIHIGTAITAHARKYIIDYAHKNIQHFVYSDTDSLHLDTDILHNIPISDKIGDFKIENRWTEAIFFTKKIYIEKDKYNVSFKCSGLDHEIGDMIVEMLKAHEGNPERPEGMDPKKFGDLQWKCAVEGVKALINYEIPYTEKHYKDFTYKTHFKKTQLKVEKKPPKTQILEYLNKKI